MDTGCEFPDAWVQGNVELLCMLPCPLTHSVFEISEGTDWSRRERSSVVQNHTAKETACEERMRHQ